MNSFDSVLDKYFPSGVGTWQTLFLCTLFPVIQLPFVLFGQLAFLSPDYRCSQPQLARYNWSFAEVTNLTVPSKDPLQPPRVGQPFLPCHEFDLDEVQKRFTNQTTFIEALLLRSQLAPNLTIRRCTHGTAFDTTSGSVRRSLTIDFDIVCDRRYLRPLSNSIYFLGMLLAYFVTGSITDNFGRRRPLLITAFLTVLAVIGTSLVPNMLTFITLRFILAFLLNIAFMIGVTLVSELGNVRARNAYTTVRKITNAVLTRPYLVFAIWLTPNWRIAHAVFGASMLCLLAGFWTWPESPRWLISQGRTKEAEEVVLRMLRWNGKKLEQKAELRAELRALAKVWENRPKEEGGAFLRELRRVMELLRSKRIRPRMLLATLLFTLQAYIYYGITFYAVRLRGDPFLIACIAGLMGIPGNILQFLVYRFFDRKRPIIIFMGIATVLFALGVAFKIANLPTVHVIAVSTLALIFLDALFSMLYVFIPELFPSNLRGSGMALASTVARFGSVAASYAESLDDFWPPLPLLLFGLGAAAATATACYMPASTGGMEDAVEEAEVEETKEGLMLQENQDGKPFRISH